MCYTLRMLQHNGYKTARGSETRRNGIPREEKRDALLEEKDRIIAELKEQVALLRNELKRKDAVLSRMVKDMGALPPARTSEAADEPRTVTPGGVRDDALAPNARQRQEKPRLPDGYRVVATASDTWVLVAPRGLRVAGYRRELDLRKAALDAYEHYRRV
jgi:hypothetical protein